MKWVSRMVLPNGHLDVTGRKASAIMQQTGGSKSAKNNRKKYEGSDLERMLMTI